MQDGPDAAARTGLHIWNRRIQVLLEKEVTMNTIGRAHEGHGAGSQGVPTATVRPSRNSEPGLVSSGPLTGRRPGLDWKVFQTGRGVRCPARLALRYPKLRPLQRGSVFHE